MLGAQGVGKSSMLIRYIKGNFSDQYHVTVGVEFATKNVAIDDKKEVKLQIWDTVLLVLSVGRAGSIQSYRPHVLQRNCWRFSSLLDQ